MLLEILRFPDPKLRRKCKEVKAVTPELRKLAEDMLETMYHSRGIGLAAAQVDKLVRLIVIDTRPKEGGRYKPEELTELEKQVPQPLVLFNPKVVEAEGKNTFDEGCLSVPGYFETVTRRNTIRVEYLNQEGKAQVLETDGLLAICIQHEIDHLDGKLFIDRLSPIKSGRIKSRIKKYGYDNPNADKDDNTQDADEDTVSTSPSRTRQAVQK